MPFAHNVSASTKDDAKAAAVAEIGRIVKEDPSLAVLRSPATVAIKKLVDMMADDERKLSVSIGGNVFGEPDALKGASLTVTVGYLG
jgi:hypothetical protein